MDLRQGCGDLQPEGGGGGDDQLPARVPHRGSGDDSDDDDDNHSNDDSNTSCLRLLTSGWSPVSAALYTLQTRMRSRDPS